METEQPETFYLEADKPNRINPKLLQTGFKASFIITGLKNESVLCKDGRTEPRVRIDLLTPEGYEAYLTSWDLRTKNGFTFEIGKTFIVEKKASNTSKLFVI